MILLGYKKTNINGKEFTLEDSRGTVYPKTLGLPDNFCGGSVKELRKTDYGIYMLLDRREQIINLGYYEDDLTTEGLKLLLGKTSVETPRGILENSIKESDVNTTTVPFKYVPENDEKLQSAIVDRTALIAEAKLFGIKGKLATLKTDVLIEKIKEVQNEKEEN